MKAWQKAAIASAVALIIVTMIVVNIINSNPVGASKKVYDEALEVFLLVEEAYKEDRPLTSYESAIVNDYDEKFKHRFNEQNEEILSDDHKARNRGFAAQDEIFLMGDVSSMANWYDLIDDSMIADSDDWDEFHKRYKKAKAALGLEE